MLADRLIPEAGMSSQAKSYEGGPSAAHESLTTGVPRAYAATGCDRAAELGLLDKTAVEKAMNDFDTQPYARQAQLFMVPVTERWLATHG